jgi:hypothetical protein
MKLWKVHLAWALGALVLSFLWSRWTLALREPELMLRELAAETEEKKADGRASLPVSHARPAGAPDSAVPAAPRDPGALSEEESFVESIRLLLRSSGRAQHFEAMRLLERIPRGSVKVELLRLMLTCDDDTSRYSAVTGLIQELGPEAMPLLANLVISDPIAYIRRTIAGSLGLDQDPSTFDLLLEATRDSDRQVRVAAAASLHQRGQSGPAESLFLEIAPELRDSDGAVRRDAVFSICALGIPSSIPLLLSCLRDSNRDVREAAAGGLAPFNTPGLLAALEALLKDPDPVVARSAEAAIDQYRKQHAGD